MSHRLLFGVLSAVAVTVSTATFAQGSLAPMTNSKGLDWQSIRPRTLYRRLIASVAAVSLAMLAVARRASSVVNGFANELPQEARPLALRLCWFE
jgi:hypothetical protein